MPPPLPVESACDRAAGRLGLYRPDDFVLSTGDHERWVTRQAAWYFRDQTIAAPRPGLPVATFGRGVATFDDVRAWASSRDAGAGLALPPLVWVAAPSILRHATLDPEGGSVAANGAALRFGLVPKIALNRSWFDDSSLKFLSSRAMASRGTLDGDRWTARSLWPEDFRIGPSPPAVQALPQAPDPCQALRAWMRAEPRGGAASPFEARTLWQRDPASDWSGRPVLALIVNGAQGDDDEAHGGHFAVATGTIGADGDIGDWMVNNFYSLDIESEKGILAAPVPLANYLGDLNAGQGWYRPSAMMVLVLRDARAAELVQGAFNRVYHQFYRHQLAYYHPSANCTSISIDTLRALGWGVRERGPSSRLLAWLGFPYFAVKERSLRKAQLAFDYLVVDQTRLMPAAAFEESYANLLQLVAGEGKPEGLAAWLAADVEAIALARFPQFPSSRALGDAPTVTAWEYDARWPKDRSQARIVPVPPRPFPDGLRDDDLLPPPVHPSAAATWVWGALTIVGLPWMIGRWLGRRARRR